MFRKSLPALVLLPMLTACAVVRSSYTRPDYDTFDKSRTLRLRVAVAPLPDGQEPVGRLWAKVARKYVNDRRDFIVKEEAVGEAASAPCGQGIEGTLRLQPNVRMNGGGVESEVTARLLRCDGTEVWRTEAGGTFASDDSLYRETAGTYAASLGDVVRPYVGPAFRLLQATLERLPVPAQDPAVVDEKIEQGD